MAIKHRSLVLTLGIVISITIMLCTHLFVPTKSVEAADISRLYITEVQVRDAEFIELYNPSQDVINLAGWQIKYRGTGATELTLKAFTPADAIAPQELILLTRNYQSVPGIQNYSFTSSLANESGYIAVLNNNSTEVDLVGWGPAAHKKQTQAAAAPGADISLQRCFIGGSIALSDPPDNSLDFSTYAYTTPGSFAECIETDQTNQTNGCYDHAGDEVAIAEGQYRAQDGTCQPVPSCAVVISEISSQPNLGGREYIEFYNQSEMVAVLDLCLFRINGGADRLLSGELQPKQYYVMSLSNGTIRNSAGVVTVLDSALQEVHYNYPESKAGQTINFALGDTNGYVGAVPTPELENIDTRLLDDSSGVSALSNSLADCGPGKYRNPETNRCKNIEVPASLQPCDIGQERNPATNRCRKIPTTTLTPCKAGQERNPDTNRCRKIDTGSSLVPCQPGQERNPETNRCRKIVANTANPALAAATNGAAINPAQFSYKIIAGVLAVALGYGVYEYRTDISNYYQSWRSKRAKGRPPG